MVMNVLVTKPLQVTEGGVQRPYLTRELEVVLLLRNEGVVHDAEVVALVRGHRDSRRWQLLRRWIQYESCD